MEDKLAENSKGEYGLNGGNMAFGEFGVRMRRE